MKMDQDKVAVGREYSGRKWAGNSDGAGAVERVPTVEAVESTGALG